MKATLLKLICLTLILSLLLPFAFACGSDDGNTEGSQSPESEKTSSTSSKDKDKEDASNGPADTTDDPFAGISEKEKALALLNIDVDDDIFKTDMFFSLTTSLMGYKLEVEASGVSITSNVNNVFREYEESKTSMTMAGTSSVQKNVSGYIDGKAFSKMTVDGIVERAIYEEISADEYLSQKDDSSTIPDNFGITDETCGFASFEKDTAGNYVATFKSITKEGLDTFKDMVSSFEGMITGELVDVTLVLTVSEDMMPVSMTIDFIFDSTTPTDFTFAATFTFGDSVIFPEIDWSEYSEKVNPENFINLSPEEQAFELLRVEVDEELITMDSTMSFSIYVNSYKLTLEMTQKSIMSFANDSYAEYTVTTTLIRYAGAYDYSVVTSGYMDGKAFTHATNNHVLQGAVYKTMTAEEYLELKDEEMAGTPEYFGISKRTCGRATCSPFGNGYSASYLQLSGEALEYFTNLTVGYMPYLEGIEIRDVHLTVNANENLYPTRITAVCMYIMSNPPEASIDTIYTYGVADFPEMDWSIFTDADDSSKPPQTEI